MKAFDCDLYIDLMPLVADGVASETSRAALEEHLRQCESCAALYRELPPTQPASEGEAEQTLKKIRRRMRLTAWTVLVIAALVGGLLSMTGAMGYNLILFPVVGIIACLGLGGAPWRVGAGVAVLSLVWTVLRLVISGEADGSALAAACGFSLAYGVAFEVGVGVVWLLRFALRQSKEDPMKRNWKQIFSGVLAVGMLALVLYVCDMFLGNPISWAAARSHSQSYLVQTYPEEYLIAGEPEYDWYSTQGYDVVVESPASSDGGFLLRYDRLGRLMEDTRESWVEGGLNTFDRISTQCQMEILDVQAAIEEETGLTVSFSLASDWPSIYDDVDYPFHPAERLVLAQLQPDGDYDTRELLARYGHLELWGQTGEVSEAELCRILTALKEQLDRHNIPMATVNVGIFDEADNGMDIAGFPVSVIGGADLAARVHEARIAWDAFEVEYEAYLAELNAK